MRRDGQALAKSLRAAIGRRLGKQFIGRKRDGMHQHFNRIALESREKTGEFRVVEDIATIALDAGVV